MQTFLPYPDFQESASVLDRQRLGNQRNEARQILEILLGKESRWENHPAVLMWKGFELSLAQYGLQVCVEWRKRGYKDKQFYFFGNFLVHNRIECPEYDYPFSEAYYSMYEIKKPFWLGKEEFHLSHRSNLLRKNFEHYFKYFGNIPTDLPYYWPAKKEK